MDQPFETCHSSSLSESTGPKAFPHPHFDLSLFLQSIESVQEKEGLASLKVDWFGKTGLISQALKALGKMDPQERREHSPRINAIKEAVHEALIARQEILEEQAWQKSLCEEKEDMTLPIPRFQMGRRHPITQAMGDIIEIFSGLGFSVRLGPDIETEWHNFDALNVGPDHPARAQQDTFYFSSDFLLRTHTSPAQIRTMLSEAPPLRMLSPGRVYRCDYDRTHTPMFHQIEGLVVEPHITMAHLKGVLSSFLDHFFGRSCQMRLRPAFFPFTEPSAEVDIAYRREHGRLILGEGEDWMEVLGCGMVHEHVFQSCHIDTSVYQGFAFGMGVERLAMLKYGIDDLRLLYHHDQRWLSHYGFHGFDAGL